MKKTLFTLFWIITLWLINFWYCDECTVNDKVSDIILFSGSKSFNTSYVNMFNYWDEWAWTYCLTFTSDNPQTLTMWFANWPTSTPTNLYSLYNDQYWNTICLYWNKPYLNVKLNSSSNTIDYEIYKLTDLLSDDIPCGSSSESCDYSWYESQISSLSRQLSMCTWLYERLESDYSILDWNYNTCTSELSICMSNSWTSWSGEIQWSSLFINDVQHLWNKNIYIDIPLDYEFSYTNEWEDFELTVEWLNQDYDYINWVINKQNYIPTSEDLSNVFSNFGLFWSLLVVCLFVILVFYMIKKIFN